MGRGEPALLQKQFFLLCLANLGLSIQVSLLGEGRRGQGRASVKVVREAPRRETLAAARGQQALLPKSHFCRGLSQESHTLSLSSHPT